MKYDRKDETAIYAMIITSFILFGIIAYAVIVGC